MNISFSEKQKKYYDLHAAKFDKRSFCYSRINRNHYKKALKIIEVARIYKPKRILEVGVGTGLHAYWLIEALETKFKYVGVDISGKMLVVAKRRLKKFVDKVDIELVKADALSLPFKNDYYDLVYCSGTLHHTDKPRLMINEMIRVLNSCGKLVVIEPNILFPFNFLVAVKNPIERNMFKMNKKNFYYWAKEKLEDIETGNLLYTPPFPQRLSNLFDKIDDSFSKIPIIRSFSIMIYLIGSKG